MVNVGVLSLAQTGGVCVWLKRAEGGGRLLAGKRWRHVPYAGAAAAAGLYPYGVPKPVGGEVTGSTSMAHLFS